MDNSPFVTVRYVHTVIETLEKEGYPMRALLKGTRITNEQLARDYSFISLNSTRRLFQNALSLSHQSVEELCFRIGTSADISTYGAPGLAAMCSANIKEALEIAEQYSELVLPGFTLRLSSDSTNTTLTINAKYGIDPTINKSMSYSFIGSFLQLLSTLTGIKCSGFWQGMKIDFPFEKPADPELQIYIAGRPIRFNADSFSIHMSPSITDLPIRWANKFARKQAVADCHALLEKQNGGIVEQLLLTLMDSDYQFPSADSCAKRFGISSRQLHRVLSEHGLTYRNLLRDVKMTRARSMLDRGNHSITNIADVLGYTDTSNFSKAFKAEVGVSPSDYSKSLRVK